MPKRLTISPHLTIDELEQCYRQAQTVTERSHYQVLWLLAQGKASQEVADITGYGRNWIYELVRSYNQLGVEALEDLRRHNPGALPKLNDVQQANLLQAIRGAAPDGGLWNGRKVADYLSEVLGTPVSRQQEWNYLKQMDLRLRVPRPQHQQSDIEAQQAWQKKLHDEVERVQQQYPDADVEYGVKMSTALACNRSCVEFGLRQDNRQLPQDKSSKTLLSISNSARING